MSEYIDTIVVGGGQAGLSVSWHLKRVGREHHVVDRGKIGDTWRKRWDSFCLVTPNSFCQLPGFPYDGDDPEGFMLRDQIVDYVERFAMSFGPPYRGGVEVLRVGQSKGNGRFSLDTSDGLLSADNVIIAAGTHQHPNIPPWASKLADNIVQLHRPSSRRSVAGRVIWVARRIAYLAPENPHLCVPGRSCALNFDYPCALKFDQGVDSRILGSGCG